ncbi:MAG TPA: MFS transporter [Verrucomicrobiae bacterium]|nr:MFS transporter [Verrucomicrobiae bacterium]
MSNDNGIVPNAKRLLFAGFMAILAAGVGAAIRGGILANWQADFGFTAQQLGEISGAGFTGFCFGIIIGGMVCDKIGYGKLVIAAFVLHVLSAVVALSATKGMDMSSAYLVLFFGTFLFAVANGTLEAVANPLVATLFPHNRTHYLNILHASWPAGLVIGGWAGALLGATWSWKAQLALFLVPTAFYAFLFFGQKMPKSEASEKGLSLGEMMQDVGLLGGAVVCFLIALFVKDSLGGTLGLLTKSSFFTGPSWTYLSWGVGIVLWLGIGGITRWSTGALLLFVLFLTHALIGAVELGTDGWIQNITGNILTPQQGKYLFVFTSAVMFALRFCADFIEKKAGFSPVALLLTCASLACFGLNLVSGIATFGGAMGALAVYAIGKTFFWPTMLAVASDRFPRTGAVAISIMGGIGMMSAGLLGSAGLGYAKDRFAGEALNQTDAALYAQAKAATPSKFLMFDEVHGIDGGKAGAVATALSTAINQGKDPAAAVDGLSDSEKKIYQAGITGDRKTLKVDSMIPLTMAVIYLGILLYFKSIGGYKVVHIDGSEKKH